MYFLQLNTYFPSFVCACEHVCEQHTFSLFCVCVHVNACVNVHMHMCMCLFACADTIMSAADWCQMSSSIVFHLISWAGLTDSGTHWLAGVAAQPAPGASWATPPVSPSPPKTPNSAPHACAASTWPRQLCLNRDQHQAWFATHVFHSFPLFNAGPSLQPPQLLRS